MELSGIVLGEVSGEVVEEVGEIDPTLNETPATPPTPEPAALAVAPERSEVAV